MLLTPIIERELRVGLRKHGLVKSRFWIAAGGVALSAFFLLLGKSGESRFWANTLNNFLLLGGIYFATAPPAKIGVGLFSEERRNQTLELLWLTGMNWRELFAGKILSLSLVASSNLLALFPLLALPFLSGGLSGQLFLATVIALPVLFLWIVSFSVLASAICWDEGSALVLLTFLIVLASLSTVIPYQLGVLLTGTPPFSSAWLCISPAYGLWLVDRGFSPAQSADFRLSTVFSLLWALLALFLAAWILSKTWRNEPDRFHARWKSIWAGLSRKREDKGGSPVANALDTNAYQWLVENDRRDSLLAWGILLFVTLLWLTGWRAWPHAWPSTMNFFVTAMFLIVSIQHLILHAAARRLGEDRRDGALELLLTTPLKPSEMVTGQLTALRRQFQPIRWTLCALCIVMMAAGFATRSWTPEAIASYIMIWCLFFAWSLRNNLGSAPLSMWIALNSGRPIYSVFRCLGGGWQWIWMIYNLRNIARNLGGSAMKFPTGSFTELVVISIIALVAVIYLFASRFQHDAMEDKVVAEIRSIAQLPVPDPHDLRFKNWNIRERLGVIK